MCSSKHPQRERSLAILWQMDGEMLQQCLPELVFMIHHVCRQRALLPTNKSDFLLDLYTMIHAIFARVEMSQDYLLILKSDHALVSPHNA